MWCDVCGSVCDPHEHISINANANLSSPPRPVPPPTPHMPGGLYIISSKLEKEVCLEWGWGWGKMLNLTKYS